MAITNSFNNKIVDGLRVSLTSSGIGDIWYRDSNGLFTRLAIGSSGQVLTVQSGLPSWQSGTAPSGNAGGDLNGTYPNPTIANNAVTYTKIQNISATQRLLGRNSAGAGVIEELAPTTARTLLGLGTAALVNTGTSTGNVPILDGTGKIDASLLPNAAINSIQVVADQTARLALSNVEIGDAAKQTDNGITYWLQALPASTNSNWISIGDTSIDASDIISGTISTARLGSGTANANTVLLGNNTWSSNFPNISFTTITTSQVLNITTSINTFYINTASLCTITLPTTIPINTIIKIVGIGTGGWRLAQNSGQTVNFIDKVTTTGSSGYLDTANTGADPKSSVELICTTANTTLYVTSSVGNIDIV